ncbi:CRISPR-associated helicase/endonuclease Cas3 [Desulfotomaculum copahuensis]|uniref:CRISPR-associated helicase/endonuclease Cas3 n=1 Tax=Desulfotomaculum copahuensis TaxID=1838280 RepID=A0A1B7LJK0_9FIRM|nr:CRISPR-associated helicase/endonuclease Cas3 [Desulfotomaculum copahuensis]OAT86750.1 CRISPR-associated helicase/endonuclease Cas3 [Desulfotomaculum copahuensis]
MNERINSHPHLFLKEHIEQVKKALEGIWSWHLPETITPAVKKLLGKLTELHDLGKGTSAFQEYIKDPPGYRGAGDEKSHTPLSLLFTLAIALDGGWDELDTLILAAAARGHHGRLPTVPEKKLGGASCPEWDIDNFAGGEKARLLKKQLSMVNFSALAKETGVDLKDPLQRLAAQDVVKFLVKLKKFLINRVAAKLFSLSIEDAVDFRLKAQLVYSMLLEADKAFLAVSDPERYLKRDARQWQARWIDQYIGMPGDSATNQLRQKARREVMVAIDKNEKGRIFSLTAPTGSGKTLLAANWAFKLREKTASETGKPSKIIVVLPFLSIIDQTTKVYGDLLQAGGYEADGAWLLTSHSLADRNYAEWLEEGERPFYVDTWRSELIITTYDQFLMSLMDPEARYQMRFHNLCDAVIIMDEVQSLPCRLWQPLEKIFKSLVTTCNSRILLMSATLPPFVSDTLPLLPGFEKYFSSCKRYVLRFRTKEKLSIEQFCEELESRLPAWAGENKRVLLTLNTRRSARRVRDALAGPSSTASGVPVYFISADVTPGDRLEIIKKIKAGKPCIVVSTQCIEAGVDIDMDLVLRDFAPLDSLVQIAGRCNREGKKGRCPVEIVDLVDEEGERYSEMIYDPIHLQVTRDLIENETEVPEEEVLELSNSYFQGLFSKKDTGGIHLIRFARWQEDLPVHELLRGKEKMQYTFLVIQQDPQLKEDMARASGEHDRWKRREAWRRLAGRIARISVGVYARPSFHPQQIAEDYLGHWILQEGYYSSERGLLVEGETRVL